MIDRTDYSDTVWREPDLRIGNTYAVWYGPAGVEGDCATEIEHDGWYWRITEYQHVGGLVDEYQADTPFLTQTTYIDTLAAHVPLRYVVSRGVDYMGHYGGSEGWEEYLPGDDDAGYDDDPDREDPKNDGIAHPNWA